ncbi:MAG: DNA-protecting protein DprA, partial [bacterium]
ALEQGREVYAVPGEIDSDLHKGCHMLIKQGAGLVENTEDILDYLQIDGEFTPPGREVEISSDARKLLEEIQRKPVHIDVLMEKTGMDMGECSQALIELEDQGLVIGLPGKRYQRSRDARHLEIVE